MVLVGWSHRAVTDEEAPTNRTACSETSLKHRSRRTNSQTAALSEAPGVCSPSLLAPRHRGRLQTVTCHARTVSAASAPCGHSETLGMSWSWDCGHVRGSRECPGASAASKRDAATRGGASGTALQTHSHLGGQRPVQGGQVIGWRCLEGRDPPSGHAAVDGAGRRTWGVGASACGGGGSAVPSEVPRL